MFFFFWILVFIPIEHFFIHFGYKFIFEVWCIKEFMRNKIKQLRISFPSFFFAADAEWVRKICCIWRKLLYAFLRSNQPRTAKFMLKNASLLLKNFHRKEMAQFSTWNLFPFSRTLKLYTFVVNNDLQGISPFLLNKVAIDHILKSVKMIHF